MNCKYTSPKSSSFFFRTISTVITIMIVMLGAQNTFAAEDKTKDNSTPAKENKAEDQSSTLRQFSEQVVISDGQVLEITIVAVAERAKDALNALSDSLSRAKSLDSSLFAGGGIAEKLNSLGKKTPLQLPKDVFDLISKAVTLSGQTGGWFDVAAPSRGGSFSSGDWRKIDLDPTTSSISFKSGAMKLDLSKIAIGFIVDISMDEIQKAGFTNALVKLGTVQRTIGQDIYTPWSVSISYGSDASALASRSTDYKVHDIAVATAHPTGLAKNFIDGLSKREVKGTGFKTVTVFAKDATEAVAYALSVYANKQKMGMKYVLKHPEIKAIVVYDSGEMSSSPDINLSSKGFEDRWPTKLTNRGPNDLKQKQSEEANDM